MDFWTHRLGRFEQNRYGLSWNKTSRKILLDKRSIRSSFERNDEWAGGNTKYVDVTAISNHSEVKWNQPWIGSFMRLKVDKNQHAYEYNEADFIGQAAQQTVISNGTP